MSSSLIDLSDLDFTHLTTHREIDALAGLFFFVELPFFTVADNLPTIVAIIVYMR